MHSSVSLGVKNSTDAVSPGVPLPSGTASRTGIESQELAESGVSGVAAVLLTADGIASEPITAQDVAVGRIPAEVDLVSYSYSYPHKSSYNRLAPALPLRRVWEHEEKSHLALYVHIPFCEMRCGFCNLFTQSQPAEQTVRDYLHTLERQIRVTREEIGAVSIGQFAVGGGTPTLLNWHQLESLLHGIEHRFDFSIRSVPTSVEVSPATATVEKLELLAAFGVQRISVGVQSFDDHDLGRIGRPQVTADVVRTLTDIRRHSFPILNVDLIYGDPAQSLEHWIESVRRALDHQPGELYLYPLYVRPETGLGRLGRTVAHRVELYRAARDLLLENGYQQMSLRCFRRASIADATATEYACQRDGMIGLGCGARSYTQKLHYSNRFAVTQAGVRLIVKEWIEQSDHELGLATHGIALSDDERRRRFLILGLLQTSGLELASYRRQFGSSPTHDVPELAVLVERGWVVEQSGRLLLTESGVENSDIVGPLLYSPPVRDRLQRFVQSCS